MNDAYEQMRQQRQEGPSADVPAAVAALMSLLPQIGATWTKEGRERWINALAAVLAMCYPDPRP